MTPDSQILDPLRPPGNPEWLSFAQLTVDEIQAADFIALLTKLCLLTCVWSAGQCGDNFCAVGLAT